MGSLDQFGGVEHQPGAGQCDCDPGCPCVEAAACDRRDCRGAVARMAEQADCRVSEFALAGQGGELAEHEPDTGAAAVEVGAERLVGHRDAAAGRFFGHRANEVAAVVVPDRCCCDLVSDCGSGIDVARCLSRRHRPATV